jgi:hypothetical protein
MCVRNKEGGLKGGGCASSFCSAAGPHHPPASRPRLRLHLYHIAKPEFGVEDDRPTTEATGYPVTSHQLKISILSSAQLIPRVRSLRSSHGAIQTKTCLRVQERKQKMPRIMHKPNQPPAALELHLKAVLGKTPARSAASGGADAMRHWQPGTPGRREGATPMFQDTEGPAEVEKDVEEHQDTEIVCFAGIRSWVVCAKIPR